MSGAPFQGGDFSSHAISEVLVNKTITDNAGTRSYAVTGSNAAVLHKKKTFDNAGTRSYEVTGPDVALRKGQQIAAGADSYAVTGSDAATLHRWKVVADAGSHATTGTDASPEQGRRTVADPDSYAVSGTDASLEHGWVTVPNNGVYAVTGSDATLIYVPIAPQGSQGGGWLSEEQVRQEERRRERVQRKKRELEEFLVEAYAKATGKISSDDRLKSPDAATVVELGREVAAQLAQSLASSPKRNKADRRLIREVKEKTAELQRLLEEQRMSEHRKRMAMLIAAI